MAEFLESFACCLAGYLIGSVVLARSRLSVPRQCVGARPKQQIAAVQAAGLIAGALLYGALFFAATHKLPGASQLAAFAAAGAGMALTGIYQKHRQPPRV
jgi:hypothetical protein